MRIAIFGPDKGYVIEPDNGLITASPSPSVTTRDMVSLACLLQCRQALESERLSKDRLNTIWDDRVHTRACEVFGGVPAITFEEAGADMGEDLKKYS